MSGTLTRLFHAPGAVGSASTSTSAISVGILAGTGTNGNQLQVSWPGCGNSTTFGVTFGSQSGNTLGLPGGNFNTTTAGGLHSIIVIFSSFNHVRVYVDGLEWYYVSTIAAATTNYCSLADSVWPSTFKTSGTFIGGYPTTETTGSYILDDVSIWNRPILVGEVAAITGVSAATSILSPPPPPYSAPVISLGNRIAACVLSPPSHRYGSAVALPFQSGIAIDGNSTNGWNAPYVSMIPVSAQSTGSLVSVPMASGNLFTNNAALDLGTRVFSGSGLTLHWLTTNSGGQCATTLTSGSVVPTSLTYFDFGGFALYVNGTCASGATTTYFTGPSAAASFSAPGSLRVPVVPAIDGRYTAVVIQSTGTNIYVAGYLWATFPTIAWAYGPTAPFTSANTKFYGGNLLATNGQMVIQDLQIYDYALTPSAVLALSNSRETQC